MHATNIGERRFYREYLSELYFLLLKMLTVNIDRLFLSSYTDRESTGDFWVYVPEDSRSLLGIPPGSHISNAI